MRKVCLSLVVTAIVLGAARQAGAVQAFFNVWKEVYITDKTDKEFVKQIEDKQTQCLVCHQGKMKKVRNPYGVEVSKLINKKDAKDVEKIKKALAEVGKMHSDAKDDKSATYDEIIKTNKFPGGKLEDLQKEPEPKK